MNNLFKFDLENQGIDLKCLGSTGIAWSSNIILEILDFAFKEKINILGGDVLKIIDNKLDYTYDNWAISVNNQIETKPELIERSYYESRNYIKKYLINKNELFYFFVLTDSDKCILNNTELLKKIPINVIGRINNKHILNTYIMIKENTEKERGYLICIKDNINEIEDSIDDWVETIEDLKEYIIKKSWDIVWFSDE